MRSFLFFVAVTLGISLNAQWIDGFDKKEALDMLKICNSFSFIDLYNSDTEILPHEYKKTYTSGVFGMDNRFQIYQKGSIAVINLRGSTDKKISWLENIYSAMIPAKGVIRASGESYPYCYAHDTSAAVHSGFALGIAYLSNDLIFHINNLNRQGIYHIILTGHSQGGALANLLRAYLENLSNNEISEENVFKTYSFAAPMIGNQAFINEYNTRFCNKNSSFNIINISDPVPTFPLSYNEKDYLSENIMKLLSDKESVDMKKIVTEGLFLLFEDNLSTTVKKLGNSTSQQISKDLGPVEMPPYVQDINYKKAGNRIELNPVKYPKILKDSSILQNDSLMAIYKRGADGHFLNEELYKKEPWTYQHKPYNYYVSFLEKYFPEQYLLLEKKYLPENL